MKHAAELALMTGRVEFLEAAGKYLTSWSWILDKVQQLGPLSVIQDVDTYLAACRRLNAFELPTEAAKL
eukprot:691311-Prorocentrum_lima.AAC.1